MKNLLVAGGLGLALMFGGMCEAAVTTGHRVHTTTNRAPVKLAAAHRTGARRGMRNTLVHHVHTGQHLHHNGTTANKPIVGKSTTATGSNTSTAKPTTPSTPPKK